jgi:tRNA G10  N-methylase Trm11
MAYRIDLGDCLDLLPSIPDASIDAVVCDPPYPCIRRPYGRLTEAAWHRLMDGVVAETRRVLKPRSSAVFILQPNSQKVGKMRLWVWEFLLRTARRWNLVQDCYWWNHAAIPAVH